MEAARASRPRVAAMRGAAEAVRAAGGGGWWPCRPPSNCTEAFVGAEPLADHCPQHRGRAEMRKPAK